MLLTFFLATVGWIIFRSDTVAQAVDYISRIPDWGSYPLHIEILSWKQLAVQSFCILVMLVMEWLGRDGEHALTLERVRPRALRWAVYFLLVLAVLLFFDDGSPRFIYFQF